MKYLIILALLLSGCASMAEQNMGTLNAEFNAHMDEAENYYKAGKISNVEFSKRQLMLNEHYFPEGYNTHAVIRDRIAYAEALERGEITKLEYDILWNAREKDKADREAQYQQQAAQQQNQPMNPVQALIMMNMINNRANRIGNSMQPNNLQFPTRCHSSAYGNGIDTTCY